MANRRPSADQARQFAPPSWPPVLPLSSPVFTSHTWARRSALAAASDKPSGEKATAAITSSGPSSVRTILPVARSRSSTTLSLHETASSVPSGEADSVRIGPVASRGSAGSGIVVQFGLVGHVPDADHVVPAGADELLAVIGDRHAPGQLLVSRERGDVRPVGRAPEVDLLIVAGGQELSIFRLAQGDRRGRRTRALGASRASSPVSTFQMRTCPSWQTVASCLPAETKIAAETSPPCGSECLTLPSATSQMRAVLSWLAVAISLSSGENSTQ